MIEMEKNTKSMLEKAGKLFLGIAEESVSSMQSTAKNNSKNKKFSEEYREKYSDMAECLGELKDTIHGYKERIGQPIKNDNYEVDDYGYSEYEGDFDTNYDSFEEEPRYEIPRQKIYYDIEKSIQQEKSATKQSEDYEQIIRSLDDRWKTLGYLKDIDCEDILEYGVGVIKLLVDNTVVYIVRAIELNNGGLSKKLKDLKEYDAKRKLKVYTEIANNIDKIKVEIISLGNDNSAVANSRKLEKELIQKYNPVWL